MESLNPQRGGEKNQGELSNKEGRKNAEKKKGGGVIGRKEESPQKKREKDRSTRKHQNNPKKKSCKGGKKQGGIETEQFQTLVIQKKVFWKKGPAPLGGRPTGATKILKMGWAVDKGGKTGGKRKRKKRKIAGGIGGESRESGGGAADWGWKKKGEKRATETA